MNSAGPCEVPLTIWTFVEKTSRPFANRKRKIVAARFVADSQVLACLAPFIAVGQDAPATRAKLGEQMSELMPKRAVNFRGAVFMKPRIQ